MIRRKKDYAINIMAYVLFFFVMLLTQISCVYDNNAIVSCGSEDTEALVINFNLTVPSASTVTRGVNDPLAPGNKDENYINIADEDYQILMFDKDGALVEGKLSEFEYIENEVNGGGMTSYTLTAKLNLSGNDMEMLSKFKVMVLANWRSFERSNTNSSFEYPSSFADYGLSGEAPKNIFKNGTDFNFTLKAQDDTWMPSIDKKQAIPMFGITEEVDLQFAIDMAKYGDNPSFSVPMLRSLAKIEIVNNTPSEDNITIKNCRLTAYNSKGRFIPDILESENAYWNDLDRQVEIVSLPGGDFTQLDMTNLAFVRSDEGKSLIAYFPEIDLNAINEQYGVETIPQVEVEIEADGNTYTYYIDLGEYNKSDGKFSGEHYPALLRNHKYAFNINKVEVGAKGKLTLFIETPEWDVDGDQEWAYEDAAVGFTDEGKFAWIDPAYENIIDDQNRILLVGYEPDDAVYGHFQFKPIASDNSCKWTISLIADDDTKNNHFTIQIKKSSGAAEDVWEDCGDTVTRDLDSDMVEFRIMATEANGSTTDYTARLVMTVQTFDGRVAILNLTGTTIYDSSNDKFYYVVKQITNGGDNM